VDNCALFQAAVERQDYAALQSSVAGMTKKDAVAHLHNLFPHKAKAWFTRYFNHLMSLDPINLGEILGHGDPTANKAVRNVMNAMAA
jgi:flagellar motility protein MotE (MotC chaperone)